MDKAYTRDDIAKSFTGVLFDYLKQGYHYSINGNNSSYGGCLLHCNLEKGSSAVSLAVERMDRDVTEFGGVRCFRIAAYEKIGPSDIQTVYDCFYSLNGFDSSVFTTDFQKAISATDKRKSRNKAQTNNTFIYHRCPGYAENIVSEGLKNALLRLIHREKGFKKANWEAVNWVEKNAPHKYTVQMKSGTGYKEILIGF